MEIKSRKHKRLFCIMNRKRCDGKGADVVAITFIVEKLFSITLIISTVYSAIE